MWGGYGSLPKSEVVEDGGGTRTNGEGDEEKLNEENMWFVCCFPYALSNGYNKRTSNSFSWKELRSMIIGQRMQRVAGGGMERLSWFLCEGLKDARISWSSSSNSPYRGKNRYFPPHRIKYNPQPPRLA